MTGKAKFLNLRLRSWNSGEAWVFSHTSLFLLEGIYPRFNYFFQAPLPESETVVAVPDATIATQLLVLGTLRQHLRLSTQIELL